jgi:hypothetical protein
MQWSAINPRPDVASDTSENNGNSTAHNHAKSSDFTDGKYRQQGNDERRWYDGQVIQYEKMASPSCCTVYMPAVPSEDSYCRTTTSSNVESPAHRRSCSSPPRDLHALPGEISLAKDILNFRCLPSLFVLFDGFDSFSRAYSALLCQRSKWMTVRQAATHGYKSTGPALATH